ncbi:MAG TPA: biotin/lipoyl-binding protein, partial [Thermoanaerobaculia bacterium]
MDSSTRTVDLSALRIPRDPQPGRHGRFVVPAIATLLVCLVAAGLFCARSSGSLSLSSQEVSTTRVVLVTPTQASTVLTASGYIVARSKAEISPKTVGRIAWMSLEEGQKVRKGELVARLESQELDAQRKQFIASREQASAALQNAKIERER